MPGDFLTTKEVAEHLGIHEKQVYALVKLGKIPASRVTGKWLFPRRLLDEWIESNAMEGLAAARPKSRCRSLRCPIMESAVLSIL